MTMAATEVKGIVRSGQESRFFATPLRPSPVKYFTIDLSFPWSSPGVPALIVKDLRIANLSQLKEPLAADFFSSEMEPHELSLPTVKCSSRIEIVLFNESDFDAVVLVKFWWKLPQL